MLSDIGTFFVDARLRSGQAILQRAQLRCEARAQPFDLGIALLAPGVYTATSTESRKRPIRSGGWFHSARPFFQLSAVCAPGCSVLRPCRCASAGSTQGVKSAALRLGKVSSRLPMSPLGSMQIAGMPSMAASSSMAKHKPVLPLPLPVMPTQTAWVVRSLES
jgi:hypothetical protein